MGDNEKILGGLSDQWVINILLLSVTGVGLVIGMTFPLVTLSLVRLNFGDLLIGLNSATSSLGILCIALLTGRLLARHGAFAMMSVACGLSIICLLFMPWTGSIAGWFALRFVLALGIGFLWLFSEAWLNDLANDDNRGHVMGLYGAAFTGGFAFGPLLISMIGSQGWQPFAVAAAIMAVSSLPLLLLAATRKGFEEEDTTGHLKILRMGFFVFLFAFAAGLFETTTFTFLPVYTLDEGLKEGWMLYALSALSAGGIVLQYPMGRLADIWGRYALMVVTALGILLTTAAIPFVINSLVWLLVVLFLFGGSIFGLYTLGLILLGDKFGTQNLVVANAVFIILYEAGGTTGPTLSGMAMETWPETGFIGTLLVFAALFAGLTVVKRNW